MTTGKSDYIPASLRRGKALSLSAKGGPWGQQQPRSVSRKETFPHRSVFSAQPRSWVRDTNWAVLARVEAAISTASALTPGDIYAGLTQNRSVDKFVRTG
jgi:hypothetical protein